MYALEAPPGAAQQLSTSNVSTATSATSTSSSHHHNLEQMSSNLYNLDSASVSGYSHPSTQSPYNNLAASSLLLPSTSDYHHLELNSSSASAMDEVHSRLNPGWVDFTKNSIRLQFLKKLFSFWLGQASISLPHQVVTLTVSLQPLAITSEAHIWPQPQKTVTSVLSLKTNTEFQLTTMSTEEAWRLTKNKLTVFVIPYSNGVTWKN